MCGPILALLVLVPTVEIVVLIKVGGLIGAVNTVGLLFASAAFGIYVAHGQGSAALRRLRGGMPGDAELLAGPLLVVAALLLLIPGFVTDVFGFLLLIAPLRRRLARWLVRRFGGRGGGGGTIIVIER